MQPLLLNIHLREFVEVINGLHLTPKLLDLQQLSFKRALNVLTHEAFAGLKHHNGLLAHHVDVTMCDGHRILINRVNVCNLKLTHDVEVGPQQKPQALLIVGVLDAEDKPLHCLMKEESHEFFLGVIFHAWVYLTQPSQHIHEKVPQTARHPRDVAIPVELRHRHHEMPHGEIVIVVS